jgi:tight adherence protein B
VGLCLSAGLICVLAGLIGTASTPHRTLAGRIRQRWVDLHPGETPHQQRLRRLRYLAGPVCGLLVWLLSSWPVAGIGVTVAVLGAPALFGTTKIAQHAIERLDGLEQWTRRLADLRTAGGGLEQTLIASSKTCPAPIRAEVATLAARLSAGWRTPAALHAFADDLAEPAADLVVAVLVLEAQRRGTGVARVLDELAHTVAEEVGLRRKIEADRAKPRTSARVVTAITLGAVAVGSFNHTYTAPYGTAVGQLVLAAIALAIGMCLWWMRALVLGKPPPRILTGAGNADGVEEVGQP